MKLFKLIKLGMELGVVITAAQFTDTIITNIAADLAHKLRVASEKGMEEDREVKVEVEEVNEDDGK